jgi:hypothetical protein
LSVIISRLRREAGRSHVGPTASDVLDPLHHAVQRGVRVVTELGEAGRRPQPGLAPVGLGFRDDTTELDALGPSFVRVGAV